MTAVAPAAADLAALRDWCASAMSALARRDPGIVALARTQLRAQRERLNLVAASSPTLPEALLAHALGFSSVTAEGYAPARYHPGTDTVDEVERIARERAEGLFATPHANVQPLSGSAANLAVLYGILDPGDRVLSMDLTHGGHLSHVSRGASVSKRIAASHYLVGRDGLVDQYALVDLVRRTRPRLVICGGSAYPRRIDFAAFRAAADETGALLMADISHISGLVAAGDHPSPVPTCDVVTSSTYKQLCGPRGGLVLQGVGSRLSATALDRAVFPGFQGTPDFGAIAAKAVALRFAAEPAFAAAMARTTRYARLFAEAFIATGVPVVTGGTDTHMVLADLRGTRVSGRVASGFLERCGVLANKNLVPDDPRPASDTSGIRIGTNDLGFRPIGDEDVRRVASALARVLAELAAGVPPERCGGTADLVDAARAVVHLGYVPEWGSL